MPQLPADIFVESMPHSLPILEALYAKLFLAGDSKLLGKAQSLRPEAVVWQLVKFFASQDDGLLQVSSSTGQGRPETAFASLDGKCSPPNLICNDEGVYLVVRQLVLKVL